MKELKPLELSMETVPGLLVRLGSRKMVVDLVRLFKKYHVLMAALALAVSDLNAIDQTRTYLYSDYLRRAKRELGVWGD